MCKLLNDIRLAILGNKEALRNGVFFHWSKHFACDSNNFDSECLFSSFHKLEIKFQTGCCIGCCIQII